MIRGCTDQAGRIQPGAAAMSADVSRDPLDAGDLTAELTTDLSDDLSGDQTGDWLTASLDDEPSRELPALAPTSGRANQPLPITPAAWASGTVDGGIDAYGAVAVDDDSASWERTVIGDESDTDRTTRRLEQSAATSSLESAAGPENRDGPGVDAAQRTADRSTPQEPKQSKPARTSKPSDHKSSGPARPSGRTHDTWSGRRRARRADKRLAEREAKALMHRRPLWRGRVIPKTVLGITFTMLVSGLAMAVSGTLLYMNYRYRQDQSDALVRNFPQQVRQAQRAVQNEGRNARSLIQDELEPLRKLAATAETLTTVLTAAEPSVWAVRTFDVDGQGTAGTAFVVASDDEKTFMVTSLSVVKASTAKPGPQILVRKGNNESAATLWTWDDKRDLALLVVTGLGNQPPLSWAAPTATRLGDQVFIMSGFGANDASIVEGRVGDVFADGIQHTAPIGTHFRGGPIIDSQSRVVAVASWNYAPLGFTSTGVFFAPPISASCEQVLRCLNNRVDGAGAQR